MEPEARFIEETKWVKLMCLVCHKRLQADHKRGVWYCPKCQEDIEAVEIYAFAVVNQYRPDRPVIFNK